MINSKDKSPDNADTSRRKRPAKAATRARDASSGEWVSKAKAKANPATTVTETQARPLYNGWVMFDRKGKVWNRQVYLTCAAAWNQLEAQTGLARAELSAKGYEVRSVSVVARLR